MTWRLTLELGGCYLGFIEFQEFSFNPSSVEFAHARLAVVNG